jgi:hypothetical protein
MEQLISELARVPMTVSNCTGSTNDLQQLRTPAAAEAAGCSTPVVRALVVGAMEGSIKQAADMIGLVLKVEQAEQKLIERSRSEPSKSGTHCSATLSRSMSCIRKQQLQH